MKTKFIILLIIAIAAIITSCKKDNSARPAVTVNQGGLKSAKVYSGTSDPSDTVGTIGDFYINLATDMLFGPKTVSGWGTSVSLSQVGSFTGAANGATNGQLYNGSGPPSSTLGTVGDFYLDTTAYLLYGPKTATGWGTPIAVQGPGTNTAVNTNVFTISNTQWLWNSQYVFQTSPSSYTEYFTRYCDTAVASITQNVLDDGMVMVYFTPNTSNNTNQWAPLPYEFTDGSGNFNYEIAYETNVGTIRFHYFFVQLVATATIPVLSTYDIPTYKFKVISVTGTLLGAIRKNHINLSDYQAVSRFTGVWQQDKQN